MGSVIGSEQDFKQQLQHQIDIIFKAHPVIQDHREMHPWLSGSLGDPFSGIWFISETPSLSRVESASRRTTQPTEETQWSESPGDKLLREMLVKYGFKKGDMFSAGGWNCYITNVIKEPDYTEHWNAKSEDERNRVADIWSPVLKWELENSKPRLVVVMGNKTWGLIQHLQQCRLIDMPRMEKIQHYAYIGSRAQGHLGPMHPERVAAYDKEFARIAGIFTSIKMVHA